MICQVNPYAGVEQLRRLHHLFAPSCTKLIYQRHTVLQRPNFAAVRQPSSPVPKNVAETLCFRFHQGCDRLWRLAEQVLRTTDEKRKRTEVSQVLGPSAVCFFFSFFVCAFKLITPKCLLCETIYLIVRNGLLCPILHSTAITKRQNYFVVLEKFNPEETFQDMSIFLQALYYLARLRPLGNELYKTE